MKSTLSSLLIITLAAFAVVLGGAGCRSAPLVASPRGWQTNHCEGTLTFGRNIVVEIAEKNLRTSSIEFAKSTSEVNAKLRVGYLSHPKTKWRITVAIRNAEGKVVNQAEKIVENSGNIRRIPSQERQDVILTFSPWKKVSDNARFVLRVEAIEDSSF